MRTKPEKRLEEEEAIPIVGDVLRALDYAHRHGVVPRDMKPSNVLLDCNGRAIVIDFEVALAMGEERRTRTGQTVGTSLYMSPEQITRPKSIDHRSDVYSVGCMLYEMLAGRPSFLQGEDGVGNSEFAVQHAHVMEHPVSPGTRVPGLSPELDELVMGALEKDPDRRIPGCQEFMRLLKQAGKDTLGEPADVDRGHDRERSLNLGWIIGLLLILSLVLIFLFAR